MFLSVSYHIVILYNPDENLQIWWNMEIPYKERSSGWVGMTYHIVILYNPDENLQIWCHMEIPYKERSSGRVGMNVLDRSLLSVCSGSFLFASI